MRRRIEELRQQPEHVRLRAASFMTAASGVILVLLWMTVLLPLQLRFNGSRSATQPVAQPSQQAAEVLPNFPLEANTNQLPNPLTPRVGGVSTYASPSPTAFLPTPLVQESGLPVAAEQATPSPTPSVSPSATQ